MGAVSDSGSAETRIELTRDVIDFSGLTEWARSNQAGAVVLFLGTVREMTGDRRTVALDYEAYPEMARAKMRQVANDACMKWPVIRAAISHRFGHLELGDVSVAVAVSTPHRVDAFDAGRFLIDTLKQVVPIWKQENWADGTSEWVDPTGASDGPGR